MSATTTPDAYVSSASFDAPFEAVWNRLSNPLEYPTLFPGWITAIERIDGGDYLATDADGEEMALWPVVNHDLGVIDLKLEHAGSRTEARRTRLLRHADGCAFVHVLLREPWMDAATWEARKFEIDAALSQAKELIEAMDHPGPTG